MGLKQLIVGDFHAVPDELDECWRVIELIEKVALEEQPDHIVFLGDQTNNMASLHVRVLDFWLKAFERLTKMNFVYNVIAIRGNHDMDPTHGVTAHALQAFKHLVTVVDEPRYIDDVLFLPYTSDAEEFYGWAASKGGSDTDGLICHQTFNGCQYENGFYAKDGFDLERVPQPWVISGHIHAPQTFGKLWYPGAPRWRSMADANTERAIYLVEHKDGYYLTKRFDTGPVCRRIWHAEVTPATCDLVTNVNSKDLYVVDVKGPAEFCQEQDIRLRAAGVRPRLHIENTQSIRIKESEGIGQSFVKYLDAFEPKYGTEKPALAKVAQERLSLGQ